MLGGESMDDNMLCTIFETNLIAKTWVGQQNKLYSSFQTFFVLTPKSG